MFSRCYLYGEKHKFRPRYHTVAPTDVALQEIVKAFHRETRGISRCIEKASTQQYVCDVCVWCGKVVDAHGDQR